MQKRYRKRKTLLIAKCCLMLSLSNVSYAAVVKKQAKTKNTKHQIHIAKLLNQADNLPVDILKLSLSAYQKVRNQGKDEKGVLTIIDYAKPSSEKRMWVLDVKHDTVLFNTYVAHGKGSGDLYSNHFSNHFNSDASSIGVFLTDQTYYGKHGYSLKLKGLEKGINDHVFDRHVVIHSAWYVSQNFLDKYGRLGRSWGCPALNKTVSTKLINTIKNGTVVFAYYPDQKWLQTSKYIQGVSNV